jgi:hypothetical protein
MNSAFSWNVIVSGLTSGMSGIRSPLQGSTRDDFLTQGVALGCHGSGLWPSRISNIGDSQATISKMETVRTPAPSRLRVKPLESPR